MKLPSPKRLELRSTTQGETIFVGQVIAVSKPRVNLRYGWQVGVLVKDHYTKATKWFNYYEYQEIPLAYADYVRATDMSGITKVSREDVLDF